MIVYVLTHHRGVANEHLEVYATKEAAEARADKIMRSALAELYERREGTECRRMHFKTLCEWAKMMDLGDSRNCWDEHGALVEVEVTPVKVKGLPDINGRSAGRKGGTK